MELENKAEVLIPKGCKLVLFFACKALFIINNIVVIINLAMLPKRIEYGIDRYRESRCIEYRAHAGLSLRGHDHTF